MPRETKSTPARKKAAKKTALKAVQKRAATPKAAPPPVAKLHEDPNAPLGYHIMASARTYANALATALAAKPSTAKLTVPRLQALQLIAANDGISGADIARALNVKPQTVTTIINSLTANGWIERVSIPGKGRALHTHLTREGRAQMNKGVAALAKVDEALANTYSHDGAEAAVLTDLLSLGRETFTPQAA